MKRRAPAIPTSSLAGVVLAAIERCHGLCCDDPRDAEAIALRVCEALDARPEAIALREAWADSPTQATLIIAQREMGGDREGHVLAAAARLAGLDVTR